MPDKKNQTIIGVIPARYASQRLPAKPLIDLMGKPLVQHVYERAARATLLDRVLVATDDERIEQAVRSFGGNVLRTSTDIRSGSDRVAEVAGSFTGDLFVNIQGDEPLIAPEMIDEGIRVLLADSEAVAGTLAKRIDNAGDLQNPGVVKVVFDRNRHALYFSRSAIPHVRDARGLSAWLGQGPLYKHIGLYVFRRDFLLRFASMEESGLERAEKLEQLRILEAGETVAVGLTTHESFPVDTKDDVERVLAMLKVSSKPLSEKETS